MEKQWRACFSVIIAPSGLKRILCLTMGGKQQPTNDDWIDAANKVVAIHNRLGDVPGGGQYDRRTIRISSVRECEPPCEEESNI